MEDGSKDQKYLNRIAMVAQRHNIKAWNMRPSVLK